MFKIGITGHRPERMKGHEKDIQQWITNQLKRLKKQNKTIMLITGVAKGVDQIAALAAIQQGIQMKSYFPYKHKLCSLEQYIVDNSFETRYQSDYYQKGCYFNRDRRIVDDCDLLLVVWDGKPWGGTYYTYEYALKQGKNIFMYNFKKEGEK